MKNAINDNKRKSFFTVYNVNLMDDIRVEKMKRFLASKGWIKWGKFFWAKTGASILSFNNNSLSKRSFIKIMLIEDAYSYELKNLD